ncbi:hypothetical protein M378DRAFT_550520 [Amanita muscaria Koide BX008]|uniref:Uncharacterized protein n=1 Tax=Amanita muscaria (strain Koide BX008) TaxID=946122 RepID=A0A0C2W4B3_AMAMK|nr:hypothetical protein M378DRAFT_550520 [Amanita muscaria Koide BX008]
MATRSNRHLSKDDPEPLLIAEAIAAVYENNRTLRAAGLPPLKCKTFAGITMVGTASTFYKIPVTEGLCNIHPESPLSKTSFLLFHPLRDRSTEAISQQAHHIAVL